MSRRGRHSWILRIQVAGEAIFVPSGWHHTVENLEDTLSINHKCAPDQTCLMSQLSQKQTMPVLSLPRPAPWMMGSLV